MTSIGTGFRRPHVFRGEGEILIQVWGKCFIAFLFRLTRSSSSASTFQIQVKCKQMWVKGEVDDDGYFLGKIPKFFCYPKFASNTLKRELGLG